MYLKTLTIHGFKSFADKTHFEFHPGVTGIVGPNGCGKSNVVDAVRWVLGETSAKALRGDEMADVIFNGTDKRKPVGMAEVQLTFGDCEQALGVDYNEVAICRRVFRDGRSEYRLNGTVCRLKDFQDLFAGTGIGRTAYSIMAQGQIDMLLSSKPEDRRSVFEEAAGITKFKSQKKEALRKLEFTEANLLRVADIIAEVKRQMGSLQRQAAKARRYQNFLADLRMLDTHLAHKHWLDLNAEKSESETQIRTLSLQLDQLQRRLAATESETSETREAYHAVESTINQLRGQAQELRSQVQSAEGRIGFNRERAEELQMRIQQNREDTDKSRALLDDQQREVASADEQIRALFANIESRQLSLNEHHAVHQSIVPERTGIESNRRAMREQIRVTEGQIAAAEAKMQSLTNQISADRQRHESLQKDRQAAAQARETSQVEFDELQRMIHEAEAQRNELEEKLKQCAREIVEKRKQRDALADELSEIQRAATQRRSRLEALEQLLQKGEGLEQGTQHVLRGLDNPEVYMTGVRGLLASSIEVDPQFISAIEAALRDNLQAVLLADSELASQIVDRLTSQQLGKAAIVPQDFVSLRAAPDRQLLPDGAIAWAVDKVKAVNGSQSLVDHLLCNVLIAEDLNAAIRLKKSHPDLAIATINGSLVSTEGVIFGGAGKEEAASTLRREAEVRGLRGEVEALELQLHEKEEQVLAIRARTEEQQHEEIALREQSQRAREEFSQMQGQVSVVQRALQQATAKLESFDWEQEQIGGRMADAEAQIAAHRETIAAAQQQLEAARVRESELEIEIENVTRRELESQERLNELRTALALAQSSLQSVERQKAPLAMRISELQNAINRYEQEVVSWQQRVETGTAENARLGEQIEEQRSAVGRIEEELQMRSSDRAAAFEKVTALENQLTALRHQTSELNESRSRAEVQLTRVDLRLENLNNQITERYQMQLDAFEPDPHELLLAINSQKKARARGGKRRDAMEASDQPPESAEAETQEAASEVTEVAVAEDVGDKIELPAELTEGEPDWDFVAEAVTELRQKLESIGPVNLDAIQEFAELEERHNFLETQHNDLVKSKEELLQVIQKINDTTKAMFADTFAQVRQHFHDNFRELFGPQAKADLLLVDEADPLESGIEIIAKPPGKKLQTISLLSGGERSMTAVALLFSIYMVKPSPFCILDELDAPLDESNIGRFLNMLDRFIAQSQFIIVTHNKRTMSRADVIYGVTMQEFGVSKPIGVRMTKEEEPPAKQEALVLDAEAVMDEVERETVEAAM
ncbi:MAG: chromosome segregation protein SMC [Verrucomicrobiaceae bacterium]|nr:chromosome segregation protein SMC [Verrucomicrobiaceae bacterium]